MTGSDTTRVAYDALLEFACAVLDKAGLDPFSRDAVAGGLCETSLRGVDSHGIRLLPHYVQSALSGRKNPRPDMRFEAVFPAFGSLDADNAFGHAAGMKAMAHAMEMAETYGLGAVSVGNSSHPGAMASFALHAARQGYIGMAFTHADALTRSHGGTRPYFGTNPICFAAPRTEDEPYCLDMASTTIAWNQLVRHRTAGQDLPPDVAADAGGAPTTDPDAATCLLPVGGYKGFGIASMIEVLCGVLPGMAVGRAIPAMFTTPMDRPRHLGQFYLAMRCDIAGPADEFRSRLQAMTDEVRCEPAQPGEEVMLPNDPQIREAERRRRDGIPLDRDVAAGLFGLAGEHGVKLATL